VKHVDVAVVGVGAMGSAALWRLASRRASVVGFDQFAPPHDLGSSHGESRVIRTAYFEGPDYVPLVRRAFELWRRLEQESGASILMMTGALMIGRPDSALIAGTLASARAHGLVHEALDRAAMAARYPQHRLDPDDIGVYEADAGLLRPEQGIAAAISRAEALGATIRRDTPVTAIDMAGAEGVRLVAGGETYTARHVVVSVGAWLGRLLPHLRLPLVVERQIPVWFPLRDAELYSPARFPVFLRALAGNRHRYGFPTLDGVTAKMAIHHEGAATSPDAVDRTARAEDLAPVESFVRDYMRGLAPEAARGSVCMYTNTPDEHFIIGPVPGLPALTLLGGFSGHGYKFMPVVGDIAADLALNGRTDYPIDLFAPDRFATL